MLEYYFMLTLSTIDSELVLSTMEILMITHILLEIHMLIIQVTEETRLFTIEMVCPDFWPRPVRRCAWTQ